MPKQIKTPKKLIGVEIREDNYVIGAVVERNPENWVYNTQGEDAIGVIKEYVNGVEIYGTDVNYVTVSWGSEQLYNYPLDGCLLFSDGKVTKSPITRFLEKYKLWDEFKISKIDEDKLGDGYVKAGMTAQLTSIGARAVSIRVETDEGGGSWQLDLGNLFLSSITLRKLPNTKKRALKEMEEFAEIIATPTKTKEIILAQLKDIFPNPNQFLYYQKICYSPKLEGYVGTMCNNIGISCESSLVMDTLFGKETELLRTQGYLFSISDSSIRKFVKENVDPIIKKTYSQWVEVFKTLAEKTFFEKKLSTVVKLSNCAKELKTYFEESKKKLDENFIDFNRGSKKIVFTPKGKPVKLNDYGEHVGIRQEVSAHKFFGKYFKDSGLPEYDIKCFTDEVISSYGEYRINEVEDGKIGEFYCNLTQTGWAVGSCMRDKPLKIFKLYDDNPHIFKMMAITLNGELVGRCLKVNAKLGKDGSDFVYMDRLYYKNEEVVAWFEAYCVTNNIVRKNKNNVDSYRTFYDKKSFTADIYIDITAHLGKQLYDVYPDVPYLDTLGRASLGYIYNDVPFPIVGNIHYGIGDCQHSMRVQNGAYSGKSFKGYCFMNDQWCESDVVTITQEGRFKGRTVNKKYAKKSDTGYDIKNI